MKKCECGKFEQCPRKLHSNSHGRLWIKTNEHFDCGKIENQVFKLLGIIKKAPIV